MKLNLKKYVFEVRLERFLGSIVNSWGVEANPNKPQVVLNMKSPRATKEVQQLTGCITVLGQFILKSIDKCQPFFCILKRLANFE